MTNNNVSKLYNCFLKNNVSLIIGTQGDYIGKLLSGDDVFKDWFIQSNIEICNDMIIDRCLYSIKKCKDKFMAEQANIKDASVLEWINKQISIMNNQIETYEKKRMELAIRIS